MIMTTMKRRKRMRIFVLSNPIHNFSSAADDKSEVGELIADIFGDESESDKESDDDVS